MFALDKAGLTVFRRKTEAFSRRGRTDCSPMANYAFPSGEGGPRQWWMRRTESVLHTRYMYMHYN